MSEQSAQLSVAFAGSPKMTRYKEYLSHICKTMTTHNTKIVIAIDDDNIAINGQPITFPTTPTVLESILGPARRSGHCVRKPSYVWDNSGISADSDSKSNLYYFSVYIRRKAESQPTGPYPASPFNGDLVVGGVPITLETSTHALVSNKRGAKLIDTDGYFWVPRSSIGVLAWLVRTVRGSNNGLFVCGIGRSIERISYSKHRGTLASLFSR
jgi:hypothetical protein